MQGFQHFEGRVVCLVNDKESDPLCRLHQSVTQLRTHVQRVHPVRPVASEGVVDLLPRMGQALPKCSARHVTV